MRILAIWAAVFAYTNARIITEWIIPFVSHQSYPIPAVSSGDLETPTDDVHTKNLSQATVDRPSKQISVIAEEQGGEPLYKSVQAGDEGSPEDGVKTTKAHIPLIKLKTK